MPLSGDEVNPRANKKTVGGVTTYRKKIPLGQAPTPGPGYAVRQASKFGDVGTAQSVAGAKSSGGSKAAPPVVTEDMFKKGRQERYMRVYGKRAKLT